MLTMYHGGQWIIRPYERVSDNPSMFEQSVILRVPHECYDLKSVCRHALLGPFPLV